MNIKPHKIFIKELIFSSFFYGKESRMQKEDSIKILEELQNGMFCNIGLPLTNSMRSDVTAMYLGKDKDGRYNFFDGGGACGTFKLTEKMIREKNIEITKQFDEEKTFELYQELNKKTERIKQKNRDSR